MRFSDESRVADIARVHWNEFSLPLRVDIGVNKESWRLGQSWLFRVPVRYQEGLQRMDRLLRYLAKVPQFDFFTPQLIPTVDGAPFVEDQDGLWWSNRNLVGRAPLASSRSDMESVAHGLARLHSLLQAVPCDLAVSDKTTANYYWAARELILQDSIFTQPDIDVLKKGSDAVDGTLRSFQESGLRLIHADPSNPNLQLSPLGMLKGVLDWDGARVDHVLADLAVVGQTIVFRRSPTDRPLEGLRDLLMEYSLGGGELLELEDLLRYMLLSKFESIAHHGFRYLAGETSKELVLSQPSKIRVILDLLEQRPSSGHAK